MIDPAVFRALQGQPDVEVLISLKPPNLPLAQQTTEVMRQSTAERQDRVLAALAPSDFTLIERFEIAPALSGRITKSGVEKLAIDPNVVGIARSDTAVIPLEP